MIEIKEVFDSEITFEKLISNVEIVGIIVSNEKFLEISRTGDIQQIGNCILYASKSVFIVKDGPCKIITNTFCRHCGR